MLIPQKIVISRSNSPMAVAEYDVAAAPVQGQPDRMGTCSVDSGSTAHPLTLTFCQRHGAAAYAENTMGADNTEKASGLPSR